MNTNLKLIKLDKLITEVLREGNFEIVNFPNLNNNIIDYPRYYEFVERLHNKLEETK